jgi:hypothetical protein
MYTPHTRRRLYSSKKKKSLDHTQYAKNRLLLKVCTEIHTKKRAIIFLQRGIFSDRFKFRYFLSLYPSHQTSLLSLLALFSSSGAAFDFIICFIVRRREKISYLKYRKREPRRNFLTPLRLGGERPNFGWLYLQQTTTAN